NLPQRTYDPNKAQQLLASVGVQNPTFQFTTSTIGVGPLAAQVFQQSAQAAGINIELVTINAADVYNPSAGYLTRTFGYTGWGGNSFLTQSVQALLSNAYFPETHWNNPAWDQGFFDAEATADPDERKQKYDALQEQLYGDGGYIVWGFQDAFLGFK